MDATAVQIIVSTACPSCGSGGATARHRVAGYTYLGCPGCGAAWLESPEPFDAAALFDAGYFVEGTDRGGYPDYDADATLHRRNAAERIARLQRFLPGREHPTLVDVGCASGYVLDAAAAQGWNAVGVDISAWARAKVESRGFSAFATLRRAIEATPSPDAVTFFQSLEHVHDPAAAIDDAMSGLPTGGVIVIESWDADSLIARASGSRWQQVNPPTVRHLFTRRSLQRLLEAAGAHVVESRSTAKSVSPRVAAAVVAHRSPRLGAPLMKLTDGPVGTIGIRYRLGDLVTLVAVKRASAVR